MNPVWIIDDDRSIRWVLEKALGRENIPAKSFGSADEALAAEVNKLCRAGLDVEQVESGEAHCTGRPNRYALNSPEQKPGFII